MTETYISVGKLGKPHGTGGAFRFLLRRELKNMKRLPSYFALHNSGFFYPYFMEKIEWTGNKEGIIRFEEITSLEAAKSFSGGELFLREQDVTTLFKKEETGYHFLVGYLASDVTEGEIGTVAEVIDNPGQSLLVIKNSSVMLPLADDLIVEINKRRKTILFDLPIGLLDL